ncbi:MAG: flagellar basal body rod protein FlgB [Nitrospiraceae bacterium]|nr:MAG: flagellar basal body rod protein FlgB [Nitrospiraceae bacterium]
MDKGFEVLHQVVKTANRRHKVLTSNVANADTPGYKAKDVRFGSLLKKEVKLLTTDPKHMGGGSQAEVNGQIQERQNPSWGDKNNVELNVEVAKMTENALTHDAALKILGSKIKMYKNAIRGR